MKARDLSQLESGPFDLLVIGGGIYGAWTAYDAALRGLRVALVEREDWGAGTSSASSKLIHGGLRYLRNMQFGLIRKALVERRRLSRLGPHRVAPLRFGFPVYQADDVGPLAVHFGLGLYDSLAGFQQPVARHQRWSRAAALEQWPFLQSEDLCAAFTYGDCGTDDARLCLEIVAGAAAAGAVVCNHAPAVEILRSKDCVVGARIADAFDDNQQIDVLAQQVVLCAGAWSEDLLGRADDQQRSMRLVQGTHLILPAMPTQDAFLLPAQDGRIFFLIPWYGRTLVGTTESDYHGDPSAVRVPEADVAYLLHNTARSCPGLHWQREDVLGSFTGLRALRNELHRNPSKVTREFSIEQPQAGLWLAVGGKLTSARVDAATLVKQLCAMLGKGEGPCPTTNQPFPWAPLEPYGPWLQQQILSGTQLGLTTTQAQCLAERHGKRVGLIWEQIRLDPNLAVAIAPDLPFCTAEIEFARKHEMAITEEDLWRRRIPLRLLQTNHPNPNG